MKILSVAPAGRYTLNITFSNHVVKTVDLEHFLHTARNPMTKIYQDPQRFKQVKVSHGNLSWGDGEMDLSADSLYHWNKTKQ
ncbi:MAG: DUF2442 domain-containing protein [Bacteroidetes bacterium]|nr:DUF2442 domain-containing protein [Bacteroidota bacterium]